MRRTSRVRSGVVVAEHAVFLAVVAGGIFMTASALGWAANLTMMEISSELQTASFTGAQPKAKPQAQETAPDPQPAPTPAPDRSAPLRAWHLLLVALLLSAIGVSYNWFYLRRAEKRAIEKTKEAVTPTEINQDAVFRKRQEIFRIISGDMSALLESRLEVQHLMSRRITAVNSRTDANEVRQMMKEKRVRHMMVRDNQKLVGIISDRDLAKASAKTAADLMTADPLSVEPDTLINPAITLLVQKRISCLPVVKNQHLMGVLTTTDLMMALQCTLQVLNKVAVQITNEPSMDSLDAVGAGEVPREVAEAVTG